MIKHKDVSAWVPFPMRGKGSQPTALAAAVSVDEASRSPPPGAIDGEEKAGGGRNGGNLEMTCVSKFAKKHRKSDCSEMAKKESGIVCPNQCPNPDFYLEDCGYGSPEGPGKMLKISFSFFGGCPAHSLGRRKR